MGMKWSGIKSKYVYRFRSIPVAFWIFSFETCLPLFSWQVCDLFSSFLDSLWCYHQVAIFMPIMMLFSLWSIYYANFYLPLFIFFWWTLVNFGPWPKIAIRIRDVYGGIMGLLPIRIWLIIGNMKLDVIILFASLG